MAEAAQEENPMKRMALVATYFITTLSMCELMMHKPFNSILGETYEYVTDDY